MERFAFHYVCNLALSAGILNEITLEDGVHFALCVNSEMILSHETKNWLGILQGDPLLLRCKR